MTWRGFFKSKATTWLLALGFVLAAVLASRVVLEKLRIDREIAKLQAEADKVRSDSDQLSALIKYMDTEQYQEKAAREKLNLKKDGEHVVVLPQETDATAVAPDQARSNMRQWFDYFFSNP